MRYRLLSLLLASALFCLGVATAQAQGAIVRASIPPGSLLASLPPSLILTFSETLATRLSHVQVTDPDGRLVSSGDGVAHPDARSLEVRLAGGAGGTYRVSWNAVSAADGQVTTGAFRFAVAYASGSGDLASPVPVVQITALRVTQILAGITRWLVLLVALLWAGGVLFEAPPGTAIGRGAASSDEAWFTLVAPRFDVICRCLLEILLGLLVFSWLLEAAEIATAGRVSLLGGMTGLFDGQGGLYRLIEFATVVPALVGRRPASLAARGMSPLGPSRRAGPLARVNRGLPSLPPIGRWMHLGLAALFLLALAAGSHAAGVPEVTLSAVLLAWLHDLAAAAWIGGLGYLALAGVPIVQDLDLDRRAPLTLGLLRRLIPFVLAGLAVLAVTGLFAAQEQVGSASRLTTNAYGTTLGLKLPLSALFAGIMWYLLDVQRARIDRIWTARQRLECLVALGRAARLTRAGLVVGALVLADSAALWSDVPAVVPGLAVAAPRPTLPSTAWEAAGLPAQAVNDLAFDPTNRHILWAATGAGIWRSIDDQRSWGRRGTAPAHTSMLAVLPIDGRTVLAAASDGKLYRSTDAGAAWKRLVRPFGQDPMRVLASSGGVILAGGDDGLFRSTNDGARWHLVFDGAGGGIGSLIWSPVDGRFYAGPARRAWRLFSADATGLRWTVVGGAAGPTDGVPALAEMPGAVRRLLAGTGGGRLWAAPYPGGAWQPVPGAIAAGSTVTALLPDARTLGWVYAGSAGAGAHGSVDGGTTWRSLGRGTPSSIQSLVMRPGPTRILYAGTASGVYRLTIGP